MQPSQPDLMPNEYYSEQIQPNTNDPNAVYADSMREEKLNNILQQINPDNLLTDIEWRIKGYKKNNLTSQWEKIDESKQEMSGLLVANFMSYLGSMLNQNTSMSNFSSGEINGIMEKVIIYIRDDLTANAEKYGIEGNYQEMTRIGDIVSMTVFAVLKRAQNGMEARRVFSGLKISENLTQAPKTPGVMDALKFWK